MTWPSKRSLERDVEELRPREADTPREWLDALVNRSLREGDVEVYRRSRPSASGLDPKTVHLKQPSSAASRSGSFI
jgi:hypothetical protein